MGAATMNTRTEAKRIPDVSETRHAKKEQEHAAKKKEKEWSMFGSDDDLDNLDNMEGQGQDDSDASMMEWMGMGDDHGKSDHIDKAGDMDDVKDALEDNDEDDEPGNDGAY